jgi:hypothetical protein
MKLAWRSPKFFEEPGLFVVVGRRSVCVLPVPRKRA